MPSTDIYSSKHKNEKLPPWPYMTLQEFIDFTNIVKIVRKFILTNGPNPEKNIKFLDKYVQQAYESFLKPKQRANIFFKDFKIDPKPWLKKNDNGLLGPFNIIPCSVNLQNKIGTANKSGDLDRSVCAVENTLAEHKSLDKISVIEKRLQKPCPLSKKLRNEQRNRESSLNSAPIARKPGQGIKEVLKGIDKTKSTIKMRSFVEEIIELSSSGDEIPVKFHPIFNKPISQPAKKSNSQQTSKIAEDKLCGSKQKEEVERRHYKPRPKSKLKQRSTDNEKCIAPHRSLPSQHQKTCEHSTIVTQASQDIANRTHKSTKEVSKPSVKILPCEISFEDFRKNTNIKSVLCDDIIRKHPEKNEKILTNIEKYIFRYYNQIFIKLRAWPDSVVLNDRAMRTLDDIAELKKITADQESNNTAGRESDNVHSFDLISQECNSQLTGLPQFAIPEIGANKMTAVELNNDELHQFTSISNLPLTSTVNSSSQQQPIEIVAQELCEKEREESFKRCHKPRLKSKDTQHTTEVHSPLSQQLQQSPGKFIVCPTTKFISQDTNLKEVTSSVIKTLYPNLDRNKVSRVATQFVKIKLNEMRSDRNSAEKIMKSVQIAKRYSDQISKGAVESAESAASTLAGQNIVRNSISLPHSQRKFVTPSEMIPPSNQQKKIIVSHEEIAKVKILPSQINLEDLRYYTNIDVVIRDDLIQKFPVTRNKYLLKIEKYINKYYSTTFIKLKSWPNLIKFHDQTVRTLDDLERLKKKIVPTAEDVLSLDLPNVLPQPPEREVAIDEVAGKEPNNDDELYASPDMFPASSSDTNNSNIELSKTIPFMGIEHIPCNQLSFEDHAFNTSDPLNITICRTLENTRNEDHQDNNDVLNQTVEFILPEAIHEKDSLKLIKTEIEEDATKRHQLDSQITNNEVDPVTGLTDPDDDMQFRIKQQKLLALRESLTNSSFDSINDTINFTSIPFPSSSMGTNLHLFDLMPTHCNRPPASAILALPKTPIKTETDLIIKKEQLSESQYSNYAEDVEIIPNERENTIIIDDESQTVDNLLREMMNIHPESTTENFEMEEQPQSVSLQNPCLDLMDVSHDSTDSVIVSINKSNDDKSNTMNEQSQVTALYTTKKIISSKPRSPVDPNVNQSLRQLLEYAILTEGISQTSPPSVEHRIPSEFPDTVIVDATTEDELDEKMRKIHESQSPRENCSELSIPRLGTSTENIVSSDMLLSSGKNVELDKSQEKVRLKVRGLAEKRKKISSVKFHANNAKNYQFETDPETNKALIPTDSAEPLVSASKRLKISSPQKSLRSLPLLLSTTVNNTNIDVTPIKYITAPVADENSQSESATNRMRKISKMNKSLKKCAKRRIVSLSPTENQKEINFTPIKDVSTAALKEKSPLESNHMRKISEMDKSLKKRVKRQSVFLSPAEKQKKIIDTTMRDILTAVLNGKSQLESTTNHLRKIPEMEKSMEKRRKLRVVSLPPTTNQKEINVTPIKDASAAIVKVKSPFDSTKNHTRKMSELSKSLEKVAVNQSVSLKQMKIIISPIKNALAQIAKSARKSPEITNSVEKGAKRVQASANELSNDLNVDQQEQRTSPKAKPCPVVSTLKRKKKVAVANGFETGSEPLRSTALSEAKTLLGKRRIAPNNGTKKMTKPKLKKHKRNDIESMKTAEELVQQAKHNFGPLEFISKTKISDDPQVQSISIEPLPSSQEAIDRDYLIEDASLDMTPSPLQQPSMTASQLLNGDETYFRFFSPTKMPPEEIIATTSKETNITTLCPKNMKIPTTDPSEISAKISSSLEIATASHSKTTALRGFTKPILDILKIPKPFYSRQFAYMTYLSLTKLNFSSGINHLQYESCGVPFLENGEKHFFQALIKFQKNGHYTLDIFGQSLRFLLGLTNIEWHCFLSLLELSGKFEYTPLSEEPFEKSLPVKILYYFFKTLPKFAQVTFEYQYEFSNSVRCVATSTKYDKPIDSLTKAFDPFILRQTEEFKKYLIKSNSTR